MRHPFLIATLALAALGFATHTLAQLTPAAQTRPAPISAAQSAAPISATQSAAPHTPVAQPLVEPPAPSAPTASPALAPLPLPTSTESGEKELASPPLAPLPLGTALPPPDMNSITQSDGK